MGNFNWGHYILVCWLAKSGSPAIMGTMAKKTDKKKTFYTWPDKE